jgi:hypothetical protein
MDSDLDTHWIEEFEKIDSNYQSFYTEKKRAFDSIMSIFQKTMPLKK